MTFIELGVGDLFAIGAAGPVDTESVHGIAEQWRLPGGALVGEALPRVGVIVVLLAVGVAEALVQRQDGNRVGPKSGAGKLKEEK